VCSELGIAAGKLQTFILVVRARMFNNPYHNFRHVVDVMQTTYALARLLGTLERLTVESRTLTPDLLEYRTLTRNPEPYISNPE